MGILKFQNLMNLLLALACCLSPLSVSADSSNNTGQEPFRMAFSHSMFSLVNENDARAAMKVWIMTVAKDLKISVDSDPHIHHTIDELVQFNSTHSVDGFGVTLPEYATLSRYIKFDQIAVGIVGGSIKEEYLLLVRQGGEFKSLQQLEGRSLNVLMNPRMSLAMIWLDTLLMEAHMAPSSDSFGSITFYKDVSQVALPVFFGKKDACIMTRVGFEVMGELNPQLNKHLEVLATSPSIVPTGFAFRSLDTSTFQSQLLRAMEQLGDTSVGRQILMLTQADRIEAHPISVLDESLGLVAKHQKLLDIKNESFLWNKVTPGKPNRLKKVE